MKKATPTKAAPTKSADSKAPTKATPTKAAVKAADASPPKSGMLLLHYNLL